MMVDRSLYEAVGGLSNQYVQGGYEDSDFRLRLTQKGHEHSYMPGGRALPPRGPVVSAGCARRVTDYNKWLNSERWSEQIEVLMRQHPGLEG
jgi:hypothetical protein